MASSEKSGIVPKLVAACLLAACAVCGGCSSGGGADASAGNSSSNSGSNGSASAEAAAAAARIKPLLTTANASIGDLAPLTKKPPAGKKVFYLQNNVGAASPFNKPFEQAMKALDWKGTIMEYDGGDPSAPSRAMISAIQAGADYIWIDAVDANTASSGLAAAKKAGVPVILGTTADRPTGAHGNGVYANVGPLSYMIAGNNALTDWEIADSGGHAKILYVTFPSTNILKLALPAVQSHLAKECSACTMTVLNLSVPDLTSGAASIIVAKLRSDPSLDYVQASFGQPLDGLSQQLQRAGLAGKVKQTSYSPLENQYGEIASGNISAVVPYPFGQAEWYAIDAMARLSVGMPVDQKAYANFPFVLWTRKTVPSPVPDTSDAGAATNYQQQFEKIWQVNS